MRKDLIVLAADKDMKYALEGVFSRPEALGIRSIKQDIMVHPEHDPGCALRGVQFLSEFAHQYKYGLLMFDFKGSGKEASSVEKIQDDLNRQLARPPWSCRARAVVLSPELEVWMWSDSPELDEAIGCRGRQPSLRIWLKEQGWLEEGEFKPDRPKEAFEAALRKVRRPRSASIYRQVADKVSLRGCRDESFLKFKMLLQEWFPPSAPSR